MIRPVRIEPVGVQITMVMSDKDVKNIAFFIKKAAPLVDKVFGNSTDIPQEVVDAVKQWLKIEKELQDNSLVG